MLNQSMCHISIKDMTRKVSFYRNLNLIHSQSIGSRRSSVTMIIGIAYFPS